MNRWLQESSNAKSETNLWGAAYTSWRLGQEIHGKTPSHPMFIGQTGFRLFRCWRRRRCIKWNTRKKIVLASTNLNTKRSGICLANHRYGGGVFLPNDIEVWCLGGVKVKQGGDIFRRVSRGNIPRDHVQSRGKMTKRNSDMLNFDESHGTVEGKLYNQSEKTFNSLIHVIFPWKNWITSLYGTE